KGGRPPHVLIVGADAALFALLSEWLTAAGIRVQHDVGARCDLVLVDIAFPREGGCDRLRALMSAPAGRPVVALSAAFFPNVVRATPRRHGGAAQARRARGAARHAASAAGPSRMSHGEPLGLATPKPWVRRAIGVLGVLFLASMVWTAMGPAETQRSAALAAF